MKELKQETTLKLIKTKIQNVANEHLLRDKGLNDLFGILVNGPMLSERKAFLAQPKRIN